jgi:hypothetical protein
VRFWLAAAALVAVLVVGMIYLRTRPTGPSVNVAARQAAVGCRGVRQDFAHHVSGAWVTLSASVERTLSDSFGRYRHQRFIVQCGSGQTILIVNDVSIGKRVPVSVGGFVGVKGQYIWNAQGGLVHFTHHDDSGGEGGWILWRGRLFSLPGPGWTSLRTKTWITD